MAFGAGSLIVLSCCLVHVLHVLHVHGHGRLREPPSRSSMWRDGYSTPPNYDDNQLFCGGFQVQQDNKGKCGVCGDAWNGHRENEAGGKYANGIIVRDYNQGETIPISIEITKNHKGFFEFRLCPNNNPTLAVTHDCLDEHVLRQPDGSTRYHVTTPRDGMYYMHYQLPADVTCTQCVLQWKYHTGNSWGCDEDNKCCVGCGPQEQFYGCADVAIHPVNGQGQTTPPEPKTTEALPTTVDLEASTTVDLEASTTVDLEASTTVDLEVTTTVDLEESTTVDLEVTTVPPHSPDLAHCKPAGHWKGSPTMEQWCVSNCRLGYCPKTYCSDGCRSR